MSRISIIICLLMLSLFLYKAITNTNTQRPNRQFIEKKFGNLWTGDTARNFHNSDATHQSILTGEPYIGGAKNDTSYAENIINDIYVGRKVTYENTTSKLEQLSLLMAAMVVAGFLVLFYRPKELSMPIINLTVPDTLIYIFVPLGICHLWFQFGLTFNAALDSRLALELMTDYREMVGEWQIDYHFSNARNLVDQGIIDSWCTFYYDIFRGGDREDYHVINSASILFGVNGTFWGIMHAVSLILLNTFYKQKKKETLIWVLFVSVVFSLSMVSLSLYAWYDHSSLLIAWIWVVALTALLLWNKYGIIIADTIEEKRSSNKKTA